MPGEATVTHQSPPPGINKEFLIPILTLKVQFHIWVLGEQFPASLISRWTSANVENVWEPFLEVWRHKLREL